jgi:hypothetical protein
MCLAHHGSYWIAEVLKVSIALPLVKHGVRLHKIHKNWSHFNFDAK